MTRGFLSVNITWVAHYVFNLNTSEDVETNTNPVLLTPIYFNAVL